jgi:hypothetical protein
MYDKVRFMNCDLSGKEPCIKSKWNSGHYSAGFRKQKGKCIYIGPCPHQVKERAKT